MKEVDIFKDVLQSRISNQVIYNNYLIYIRNPEIRQVYSQFRDDETRAIVMLQQKIQKLETPSGIFSKIFSNRSDY